MTAEDFLKNKFRVQFFINVPDSSNHQTKDFMEAYATSKTEALVLENKRLKEEIEALKSNLYSKED